MSPRRVRVSTPPTLGRDIKRPRQSLNEADAAAYLDVSRDYLKKKRRFGGGPPFSRIGRMIRYRVDDLGRWLEVYRVGTNNGSVDVRVDRALLIALRRVCLIATDGHTSIENGNWISVEMAITAYLHAHGVTKGGR